jgi:ABC-type lipoprotein release transport system permease subunit
MTKVPRWSKPLTLLAALTLVAVTALIFAVATIASRIPARSSVRIDPAIALRSDN